jgi:hypothetical protein
MFYQKLFQKCCMGIHFKIDISTFYLYKIKNVHLGLNFIQLEIIYDVLWLFENIGIVSYIYLNELFRYSLISFDIFSSFCFKFNPIWPAWKRYFFLDYNYILEEVMLLTVHGWSPKPEYINTRQLCNQLMLVEIIGYSGHIFWFYNQDRAGRVIVRCVVLG